MDDEDYADNSDGGGMSDMEEYDPDAPSAPAAAPASESKAGSLELEQEAAEHELLPALTVTLSPTANAVVTPAVMSAVVKVLVAAEMAMGPRTAHGLLDRPPPQLPRGLQRTLPRLTARRFLAECGKPEPGFLRQPATPLLAGRQ